MVSQHDTEICRPVRHCKFKFALFLRRHQFDHIFSAVRKNKRQLQTACGWWWWRSKALKEFNSKSLSKETTCLLFSMSDFSQFITTFICCVKQMKQELISWAHSSLLISNFRNFEDWITFRSESRWFSIEICVTLLLDAWTVQNKSSCNKMN